MKMNVKPSKSGSLFAVIFGIGFILIGITQVIPSGGGLGILWTIGALMITLYHGYNLFSSSGVSMMDVDVDSQNIDTHSGKDFDAILRKLDQLKKDNLLSEDEYQAKRQEIMGEKW